MKNEAINTVESQLDQEHFDVVAKAFIIGESGDEDGWEDLFLDADCDTITLIDGGWDEYESIVDGWHECSNPIHMMVNNCDAHYIGLVHTAPGQTRKRFVLVDFGGYSLIYWQ